MRDEVLASGYRLHAATCSCASRSRSGSGPLLYRPHPPRTIHVRVLIDHVIGGKYRITELIGQGGMGTVFEAVHTGTGSRVAIKLIVSNDIKEEVFVRFQREARAAGAI